MASVNEDKQVEESKKNYKTGSVKVEIVQVFSVPENKQYWQYWVAEKDNEGWWHTEGYGVEEEYLNAIKNVNEIIVAMFE